MSDDTVPKTDTRFGPYLLKRMLGSGGMGTVYEAEDTVMDRVVALKLISGPYAQNPDYRQRLQRDGPDRGATERPACRADPLHRRDRRAPLCRHAPDRRHRPGHHLERSRDLCRRRRPSQWCARSPPHSMPRTPPGCCTAT